MRRDVSFKQAVEFARELVQIPSLSGEEGPVAKRVSDELKMLRFDDVWVDEVGNVMARVRGKGHGPAIMLCSHLDVVDVGDISQWEHMPFGGDIDQGYLHGRGAMDCKGPLALQTYAAASFVNSRPVGDIYLVFTVFEESGCWGIHHVMERGDIEPAGVILGEATGGDICIGHRGRVELSITIRGKSAHASAPERGRNPVDSLPFVLNVLQRYIDDLPSHPALSRHTLVPTVVETWPNSRNMVPEEVRIVVDWRTLPGDENGNWINSLQTFLQNHLGDRIGERLKIQEVIETKRAYTGVERERRISTAGFLMPERHPIVRAAVEAVQLVAGYTPAVRPWTFGTDGGCLCGIYGVPTIGYAPGQEADAHTNRERLSLDAARTTYDAYPSLVQEVQKALV